MVVGWERKSSDESRIYTLTVTVWCLPFDVNKQPHHHQPHQQKSNVYRQSLELRGYLHYRLEIRFCLDTKAL